MAEIEQSTDRARFTREEIRARVAASKRFWASPEGRAEAKRQEQRKRESIRRNRGVKFPQLAGTKPAAKPSTWEKFDGFATPTR